MQKIQIILEIIILIVGFYIAFFKSYFTEKGKNLATKEDINEITSMVETVKNQIHFSTQSKLDLRVEERNALVNHYEKYNFWLHTIIDTHFSGVNEHNKHKLEEIKDRMSSARLDYELADGRMELFVSNKDLSELLKVLKIKTLEFEHLVCEKIFELDNAIFKMEQMKATTPIEQQSDKFSEYLDKKSEIIKSLNTERLEKYKEVSKLDRKFQVIVHNHLKKLIQPD